MVKEPTPRTWMERNGAYLIPIGMLVLLVVVIGLSKCVR